jgi:K+-transporting ATPase ATPase C chain
VRVLLRQVLAGLRMLLAMTLLVGLAYPLAVAAAGRVMPHQADGSLVSDENGKVVGSQLLGQSFGDGEGQGARWFLPRPSQSDYDPLASGGSNLGPENPDLLAAVQRRRGEVAALEGVDPSKVPADAVTASASGLDPHISPEYARLQVARVSSARGMAQRDVTALVEAHVRGRSLGFIGSPHVNVLELNLALERMDSAEG